MINYNFYEIKPNLFCVFTKWSFKRKNKSIGYTFRRSMEFSHFAPGEINNDVKLRCLFDLGSCNETLTSNSQRKFCAVVSEAKDIQEVFTVIIHNNRHMYQIQLNDII